MAGIAVARDRVQRLGTARRVRIGKLELHQRIPDRAPHPAIGLDLGNGVELRLIRWNDDTRYDILGAFNTKNVTVGRCGTAEFVLRLAPGEVAQGDTGDREVILVLVEGKAQITGAGPSARNASIE